MPAFAFVFADPPRTGDFGRSASISTNTHTNMHAYAVNANAYHAHQ